MFVPKTLGDLRQVLSFIEFVSQNAPMCLWRGPAYIRPFIQNFAKQAAHF